jgi:glycosyltransferase involved in cell wall biosynthesis
VVTAGRFHEVKGFDVLIDAMHLIRRNVPDAELVIFGDAQPGHESYAAGLRRQSNRLGLDHGGVTFAGYQNGLEQHWKHARMYVQPSRQEPFGLTVLEAMASGLPVVATRVGGMAENIQHERTGLLVDPGDADALARQMLRLLTDPALARRLAADGSEWARSNFTLDAYVSGVIAVHEAALGDRRLR